MPAILEVTNLHKHFGGIHVTRHVNFSMQTPTCLGDKECPDVAKASCCVRRVAYLHGASSHRAIQRARD